MKSILVACLALCCFACAGDERPATETPEAATPPLPYQNVAELLADGAPATRVRDALMADFALVSDPTTGALNTEAARRFAELARQLSDVHPADTVAALPLYRAAEVVRALNDPTRAAEYYEWVHERYPTFSRAPEALFMLGFTYDEDLDRLAEAEVVYRRFLETYPDHNFADDTEMLIANLGKSDEEILRDLEARRGEQ